MFARPQVEARVAWGEEQEPGFAHLARCAYQWGLRVRSEGLFTRSTVFAVDEERKAVAWQFERRKHKPVPHKLYRSCVCKQDLESGLYEFSRFCPFHTAKELLARTTLGGFLFVTKGTDRPFEYDKLQKPLKALGRR